MRTSREDLTVAFFFIGYISIYINSYIVGLKRWICATFFADIKARCLTVLLKLIEPRHEITCFLHSADQLCGKREGNQRLWFHCIGSKIPLLPISDIFSL